MLRRGLLVRFGPDRVRGTPISESVAPLDRDTVLAAARRTGRVVVVDEDYVRGGLSGEIAALLAEDGVAV